MKILSVDYGDARTGLAVCDETELLATPITPQIEEKSMNKVAEQVAAAAVKCGAKQIVLGLPRNMDGTEGARAGKSRRLGERIAVACPEIPVVFWDERRTTVSAAAILSENDIFGKKRKERLDSVSAAVILESYLNWRKHHPGEMPV